MVPDSKRSQECDNYKIQHTLKVKRKEDMVMINAMISNATLNENALNT